MTTKTTNFLRLAALVAAAIGLSMGEALGDPDLSSSRGISAMEFVSSSRGWVWEGHSDGGIFRTIDGGRHFHQIAKMPYARMNAADWELSEPRPAANRMRFADARHGWIFGPDLFTTRDGGVTWASEPRVVGELVPAAGAVWAIEACDLDRVVRISRDLGRTWTTTPGQPRISGEEPVLVAIDERRAWVFDPSPEDCHLFRTVDGGVRWRELAIPEQWERGDHTDFTADRDGRLWLLLSGEPIMYSQQYKILWMSEDGGDTWILRSESDLTETSASIPGGGLALGQGEMIALTSGRAIVFHARTCPYRTGDHGLTWRAVGSWEDWRDPETDMVGASLMTFFGDRYGWALVRGLGIRKTRDGGRTWRTVLHDKAVQ
jgi:photosystem II stability/assembly factor-like uncharacterized protein